MDVSSNANIIKIVVKSELFAPLPICEAGLQLSQPLKTENKGCEATVDEAIYDYTRDFPTGNSTKTLSTCTSNIGYNVGQADIGSKPGRKLRYDNMSDRKSKHQYKFILRQRRPHMVHKSLRTWEMGLRPGCDGNEPSNSGGSDGQMIDGR